MVYIKQTMHQRTTIISLQAHKFKLNTPERGRKKEERK